jgi:type IV pilus assembly protein PilC
VRLSFRQKGDLYREFGQLIRSGVAAPAAIRLLASESTGAVRALLLGTDREISGGAPVAEAFAAQPSITPMESSVLAAANSAGRIEQACERLSAYFEALAAARSAIVRKSLYPLFVFHFGIVMLSLPRLFINGVGDYLAHTLAVFVGCYAAAGVVALGFRAFNRLARVNAGAERCWGALPVLGKIRRSFALARFCATYEMQVDSGINVVEALATAGAVSQSAVIRGATERILPALRRGEQVGPLLAGSRVFPAEMIRSFRVGEETGRLDQELQRLTAQFERQGLEGVELLSEWIPRLIYVAILLFVGFEIISLYRKAMGGLTELLGG